MQMNRSVQREAILSELRSLRTHPTAEDLYKLLRPRMPKISIGTVYRNLEQFSRAGLVRKLDCGGELKRFDGNIDPHPHMRCPACGSVTDLTNSRLDKLQRELLELLPELDCRTLSIEFSGLCRSCRIYTPKEEKAI